jgi:PAS domain-containing protein
VQRTGLGASYLAACDRATGASSEEAAVVAAGIRSVLCGETDRFALDYPCPDADGTRWFTVRVTPLGDAGGGAVLSHTDITETRLAEDAIRWTGDGGRHVDSETSPIFLMLDATGAVVHASPQTRAIFGVEPGALLPSGATDVVHPQDRPAALEAYAEALASRVGAGSSTSEPGPSRAVAAPPPRVTNLLDHPASAAVVITGEDDSEARRVLVAQHLESRLLERLPAAGHRHRRRRRRRLLEQPGEELLGHTRAEAPRRSMDELTGGGTTGPGPDHTGEGRGGRGAPARPERAGGARRHDLRPGRDPRPATSTGSSARCSTTASARAWRGPSPTTPCTTS